MFVLELLQYEYPVYSLRGSSFQFIYIHISYLYEIKHDYFTCINMVVRPYILEAWDKGELLCDSRRFVGELLKYPATDC